MQRTITITLVGLAIAVAAPAQVFDFATPTDDQWQYPFNFSPGDRVAAGCFGSTGTGNPDFQDFNDRDGIMIVAWDTGAQIPPGQGPEAYSIQSITVTLTNEDGAEWFVDLTPDEWFTYDLNNDTFVNGDGVPRGEPGDTDGESDDADIGRAIELFGAGFGPIYTFAGWNEASNYQGAFDGLPRPRDPFPFVYDPNGTMLHVEDNVDGLWNGDPNDPNDLLRFTPTPWAVGVPVGFDPNDPNALDTSVPFDVTLAIDLSLSDGRVREYFQNQLDAGRVIVVITSLTETGEQAPSVGFPNFFTKEAVGLISGAKAPQLQIVLGAVPVEGDLNDDGCVDLDDLTILLQNFQGSGAPAPGGDVDGDGDTDLDDLTLLLQNFGAGDCP
jgi:hypothetical protein